MPPASGPGPPDPNYRPVLRFAGVGHRKTGAPIARKLASVTDNKATYNGYKEAPTRKLDHIFFSNCLAYRFKTLTQNYGVPYISDHYPVKALFVIPSTE